MSRYTVIRFGTRYGVVDNEADHSSPERFVERELPNHSEASALARKLNREHEEEAKR